MKREELLEVGWENAVRQWVPRKTPEYRESVVNFFEQAFEPIEYPDKAKFGVHKTCVCLSIGHIWLASYEQQIWLLVDRADIHPQFKYRLAKSTVKYEPLYWLLARRGDLQNLLQADEVWESYRRASQKVLLCPFSRINIGENEADKVTLAELLGTPGEKTLEFPPGSELKDTTEFAEGGLREVTLELQRRDPRVKRQAIQVYGCRCQVCGFSFEEVYGPIGKNYIEVHHLIALSERKEETVTRVEDVAVVCANCHRMLHRGGAQAIALDELRSIVEEQKRKRGVTPE